MIPVKTKNDTYMIIRAGKFRDLLLSHLFGLDPGLQDGQSLEDGHHITGVVSVSHTDHIVTHLPHSQSKHISYSQLLSTIIVNRIYSVDLVSLIGRCVHNSPPNLLGEVTIVVARYNPLSSIYFPIFIGKI